jgi:hypothetical protein
LQELIQPFLKRYIKELIKIKPAETTIIHLENLKSINEKTKIIKAKRLFAHLIHIKYNLHYKKNKEKKLIKNNTNIFKKFKPNY